MHSEPDQLVRRRFLLFVIGTRWIPPGTPGKVRGLGGFFLSDHVFRLLFTLSIYVCQKLEKPFISQLLRWKIGFLIDR